MLLLTLSRFLDWWHRPRRPRVITWPRPVSDAWRRHRNRYHEESELLP